MVKCEYVIDGHNLSTLEEFWDEISSVLIPESWWGETWMPSLTFCPALKSYACSSAKCEARCPRVLNQRPLAISLQSLEGPLHPEYISPRIHIARRHINL